MEPIHWAILLSFIIGACGYVIVRMWILPIARYKRVKAGLTSHLIDQVRRLPEAGEASAKASISKKSLKEIRRMGMKLVTAHDYDLPYWYRLVLVTRKESPQAAIEAMLKLENLQSVKQVQLCLVEVGGHLGLQL